MVGLTLAFLAVRLSVLNISNPQMTLLIEVIAAVVGYYMPDFWLRLRTE